MRKAVEEGEAHQHELLLGQPFECCPHRLLPLLHVELAEQIRSVTKVQNVSVAIQNDRSLPTQPVDPAVTSDPMEPGRERGLPRVEQVRLAPQGHHRVLRNLLGGSCIATHTKQVGLQPWCKMGEELRESLLILPLGHSAHERWNVLGQTRLCRERSHERLRHGASRRGTSETSPPTRLPAEIWPCDLL